jgi:putative zinc finger protein
MMLSCKEVTHLVSAGLDRKLGFVERVRLRLHLAVCDGCSHFTKQVKFIRKAMRELGSRS